MTESESMHSNEEAYLNPPGGKYSDLPENMPLPEPGSEAWLDAVQDAAMSVAETFPEVFDSLFTNGPRSPDHGAAEIQYIILKQNYLRAKRGHAKGIR